MSAYLNGKKVSIAYAGNPNFDTLRDSVANAFKGKANGRDAVRMDGVSPIPHTMSITLTPYNLIDQDEFFASDGIYELSGEVGKTYVLSCEFKEGATIYGSIGVTNANGVIFYPFDGVSTQTFTIEEGNTYVWDFGGATASDLYESVSMVLVSADDVTLIQYGKNLIDYDKDTTEWSVDGGGRAFYFETPCESTFSIQRTDDRGSVILYRSTDNFATEETVGKGVAGNVFKPCTITPEYKYKLYATKATIDNKLIEWMQLESGTKATEYEEYKEPTIAGLSYSPTTTLVSDAKGVEIAVEYNRDSNVVYTELVNAIRKLGGTV